MSETPVLIELERREGDMILRWADQSEQTLDYVTLRSNCPCANCGPKVADEARRDEFEASVKRLRNEKPNVEVVGGYGLRFEWDSGCNSGIFGFELLRELADDA